jgi:glutamate/tyrosine decarboxylase-like PLP-dependent enzyme
MSANRRTLPKKGRSHEDVLAELETFGRDDPDYRELKAWSLVYFLDERHEQFLQKAHNSFFSANGLNPMAFKSLKRFESEVISMTARMLGGDDDCVGTMTSGGTESCMLAVKTYRDLARARKPWIMRPEMVVPETAHVAWFKGAEYFGVRPVVAPLAKDLRVDVKAVKRRINRSTVMILGSAPEYPHGRIDPIDELGAMAKKRGIPLHVDACLGGYLLPFVEKLGYGVPPWDFRVPGVTSISADTHKYGFAAKGASTITYRNIDYLEHQMFVHTDWPGGVFASPAMLGTRPGGCIAAAWAAMQAQGEDGYLDNARRVMATTEKLIRGIDAIEGLEVIGKPQMSVFGYRSTSRDVNIFAVGDQMEKKGWHVDRLQKPDGLHAMVTPGHDAVADGYLTDLAESVAHVRRHPELATEGGAAMYGMISHIPLRGMIRKSVIGMMKKMYGPEAEIPDNTSAGQDGGDWIEKLTNDAGIAYLKVRDKVLDRLG